MPTAIVTGATGILGREIVHQLAKTPNIWTTIHAVSRSQKEPYPSHVHHDAIDLLAEPEAIAKQLKDQNVEAEYLFFTAYLQQGDEVEMERVNGDMLLNFLTALSISGAERTLKRVVLTTGAKHYGVHLGPVKCPMQETDPWIEGEGRPPNFYYRQQRVLRERSQASQNRTGEGWDWVVTYPNDVIGVARDNFMNLTTALGIYATITKELSHSFRFPGSADFYTRFDSFTSARFHAVFCLWASQTQACSNEAFNVVNGDVQSWQTLWPLLARRFGLEIPPEQFQSLGSESGPHEKILPLIENPPVKDWAAEMGIADRVRRGEVQMVVDLEKWASREDVKGAWARVAKREGVQEDALGKATWFFLNFVLGRNYDVVVSMEKARRFGFTGSVDSWEALNESLDGLVEARILPS